MSGAQEARKAAMWESQHSEGHELRVAALRAKKARLDSMSPDDPEFPKLKAEYESEYETELAFFEKFHP